VEAAHCQAEALGARLNSGASELASYGVVLAEGEVALSGADPLGAMALARLIERLGAATTAMVAANARLNHELADAAQETGRLNERLRAAETAAVTDPLTGVLNRRGALRRLEAAQAAAQAAASALSVAMVDIDHFK
ncbi:diguanylate cyclase domain-containing protein, partial [Escherichia coli]|uniref:diguanylate cyclase domain-containing protein n=1 Tax=Escherichia coli TaxID=562 RepID=UPI0022AC6CC6